MSTDALIKAFKHHIDTVQPTVDTEEVGKVTAVGDGIAHVRGLRECQSSELLTFDTGAEGVALDLGEDSIGVVILGSEEGITEGTSVTRTGQILSIPVSMDLIGRVIDPLARPLDAKDSVVSDTYYPLEKKAPGVMARQPVTVPLETGITAIDSLIPIGRGQRELIIGDRKTGKTALALDTILNQRSKGVYCIYVSIGQKRSTTTRLRALFDESGASDYTTIISASASDPASLQYLAPYAGAALGEYLMDQGKDVLVVYDDLSKHAVAYREISLLLRRPPGREAYPGDVFYLHSRLLERACRRNDEHGGGSMTALPIIETQAGDLSAYIPTNVISITDGQIFLESDLFYKGVRPAINMGNSVSRVGGAAQRKAVKKVAGPIRLGLAQYRELEAFAQFAGDLDPETRKQLDLGARMTEVLKQGQYVPRRAAVNVALIYAVSNGYFDDVDVKDVQKTQKKLSMFLLESYEDLLEKIEGDWNDGLKKELDTVLSVFSQQQNTK